MKNHPLNVVEKVPFLQPHAFDLRFNHLTSDDGRTFLQLIHKFGLDEEHFEEYEVLIPTYKVSDVVESDPGLQA